MLVEELFVKNTLDSLGLPSFVDTTEKCVKRDELSFTSPVLGELEIRQLPKRKKLEIKAVCITLSQFNRQSFANCLYVDETLERQSGEFHSIELNKIEAFEVIGGSMRNFTKVQFDDGGRIELLGHEECKLHRFEDLPLIIHDEGCPTSSFTDKALRSVNMIIRFDYRSRRITISYFKERLSAGFVSEFGSNLAQCLQYFYSSPNNQVNSFSLCIYQSVKTHKKVPTKSSYGSLSLKSLFEASVEKFPERVALEFNQESWTYEELNLWANSIVERCFLSSSKSQPVGIYSDNPCIVIAAILAIVKSGNTYVPMDPRYPDERVVSSLRKARVTKVLCDLRYRKLFDAGGFKSFTGLDEIDVQANLDNSSCCISSDSPAYILFTSGSTGEPKGVAVSHRNVARLLSVCQEEFQFNQNDRWTVFHSFCFDFSVWEMWGALAFGGTVLPVEFSLSRNPKLFKLFLEEKRVSILNQTPSAFKQLLPKLLKGDIRRLTNLRHIIFGGEALETGVVSQWFENHLGESLGCQLTNMFGITETTVHVTIKRLTERDARRRTISLGKPLSDLKVVLLSEEGSIVPEGAVGEIFISGSGVSLGYVSQPEETSFRFPSLDIVGDGIELYYRSGDLARFLPNGELEYLGRKDNQAQVRGFRIELGEIEKALLSIPNVSVAVVTYSSLNRGSPLLLAFICQDNTCLSTIDQFKQQLRKILPPFMVPNHIFNVEEIPTTINRKIDTVSLERFAKTQLTTEDSSESNYLNEPLGKVLQHCKEVLRSQAISPEYGFFDFGGDSMTGVELVAMLEKVGIAISLEELLRNTPLKALELSALSTSEKGDSEQEGCNKFPATQLQLGMIYQSEISSDKRLYHDVFHYSVEGEGLFEQVSERLPQLILQHPVLRTTFDLSNPSSIQQVVLDDLDLPISYLDLRYCNIERKKQTVKEFIQKELEWKVNFQNAPLFRIALLQLADRQFELVLSVHHVILDGWSLSTFVSMLIGNIDLRKNELESKLDTQPMKVFVQLEQEALNDASITRRWKLLSSDLLESAGQFQRGPLGIIKKHSNSVTARSHLSRKVKPELVSELNGIAKKMGLSLKSLFLAAHTYSLAAIYNSDSISTGLITNARPIIPGVQEALGLFLNTVPLKVNVAVSSWIKLAQSVSEAEQETFPIRRYPLPAILRDAGCSSLFCSAFNFVDFRSYDSFFKTADHKITRQVFYERTDIDFLVYIGRLTADQDWQLRIDFSSSEFPIEVTENFSKLFFYALEEFIENPGSKPGYPKNFSSISLNCLDSEEAFVGRDNNTSNWILKRIAELSCSKPEGIAIVNSEKSLTYQDLSVLSSNYAQKIRTYSQNTSPIVAVELDRSLDCVAAYLGCLKAGATCVPLNPSLPSARKGFILKDSGATICIVSTADRNRSGHYEGLKIIAPNEISLSKEADFALNQITENLYLLYTSGSTGKPKGVSFSLEQFEKLIKWQVDEFLASGFGESRLLHLATIGFDVSFQEIFTSLCLGSQLHIGSGELRDNPKALQQFIEGENITHTFLPPSLFQQLARITTRDERRLPSLMQIICAGERLLLNETTCKFLDENPNVELYNQYGPTETHVVSQHRISLSERRESGEVPMGLPLPHIHLSIKNRNGESVPPFMPGEIVVERLPLAQGYLGSNSVSSGFSFSKNSSSKLYHTGDRAYLDSQGNINFLGRIDQQVKVRGFRIELDEISNALASHPYVAEAMTIAKRGCNKTTNLISFIVHGEPQKFSEEEIAHWLTQLLPHYMIPIRIHCVDKFPLTSNGKVSRSDLSQLDEKLKLKDKTSHMESLSEMESMIISVWEEVLGTSNVSKFDKFFEIGGTSLQLLEAYILLEDRLGVKFEMVILFQYVTPKQLAEHFTDSASSDSVSRVIMVDKQTINSPQDVQARVYRRRERLNKENNK